jgi:uncharacterized protein YndB with AHSA1/START domain
MSAPASATVMVRRTIDASPDELFDAWLDPDSLSAWMRPKKIHRTTATLDARVGGAFEIVLHGDGEVYTHYGSYLQIERPQRLVFTWQSSGTHDTQTLVTVDFIAQARGTEIVIVHERLPDADARAAHREGWSEVLASAAIHWAA